MAEQIILEIDFDQDEAIKALNQTNKAVDEQKAAVKELRKQIKNTENGYELYGEQLVRAENELKQLTTTQRRQRKDLQLVTQANEAAEGSYEQLLRQQQLAQNQLKNLEGTLKQNEDGTLELSEAYVEASQKVDRAKQALLEFNEGISDGRLNVGRYGAALGGLEDGLEEISDSVDENTQALKDLSKEIQIGGNSFGEINEKTKQFIAAFKGAIAQVKAFRLANVSLNKVLKASPLFLLVGILTSVVTFLTKTKRGTELLEQATAALNAVTGVLIDQIANLGELFVQAFTNPKQALTDLVDFIKNETLDNLRGLSDILKGIVSLDFDQIQKGFDATTIGKAANGAGELATNLTQAAKEAASLEKQYQELRDRQRELNVETARQQKEIEVLVKQADDVTASTTERINALQKANGLVEEQAKSRLELAKEELEIVKQQNAISDSSAEDLQKEADLAAEVFNIERELFVLQTDNVNKINALKQEGRAKELERIQKEKEAALKASETRINDAIAAIDRQLLKAEEGSQKQLELTTKRLKKERDLALLNTNLTENQRLLIVEQTEQKILELKNQFAEKGKDINQREAQAAIDLEKFRTEQEIQELDRRLAAQESNVEKSLQLIDKRTNLELESLEREREKLLENQELTNSERLLIQEQFQARETELIRNAESQKVGIVQSAEQKRRAEAEETAKLRTELEAQVVSESLAAFSEIAEAIGEENEAIKAFLKGIKVAEVIINLQTELSAIAANAAANPSNAVTFGGAGAAQYSALSAIAVARAAANVATILSANKGAALGFQNGNLAIEGGNVPSGGGMITGRSHARGGVKFNLGSMLGEAKGGEAYILNTRNDPRIKKAASQLNELGGGKAFFNEGGALIAGQAAAQERFTIEANQNNQAVNEFARAVEGIRIETKITDINTVNQQRANRQRNARVTG